MRSKASLTLLEQSVMLLVFALAAALCLKAFLWADQTAQHNIALDNAVLCAQNAAEQLKDSRTPPETRFYDENWDPAEQSGAVYALSAVPGEDAVPGLGRTTIVVYRLEGGEPIFTLPVAWQTGGDRP